MRVACLLHVCSDVPVPRGRTRQRAALRLGRLRISRQRAGVKKLVDWMNRIPEQRTLNLRVRRRWLSGADCLSRPAGQRPIGYCQGIGVSEMASRGRTKATACRARVIATRITRRCRVIRPASQDWSRRRPWYCPSTMTTASNSLPLDLCMFITVTGWGADRHAPDLHGKPPAIAQSYDAALAGWFPGTVRVRAPARWRGRISRPQPLYRKGVRAISPHLAARQRARSCQLRVPRGNPDSHDSIPCGKYWPNRIPLPPERASHAGHRRADPEGWPTRTACTAPQPSLTPASREPRGPPGDRTGRHARLRSSRAGTCCQRGPSVAVRETADGAHRPSARPGRRPL